MSKPAASVSRPFLQTLHVRKVYDSGSIRHEALRDISLVAEQGEFIALRGPSGCGKSTLLHILGGMDQPTSGEVWLAGRRLDQLSRRELAMVRRRDVGFVFQAYNLLPTLSAIENVALPMQLDGVATTEAQRRAEQALHDVGLADRAAHRPSELSGGEMQRVAIARALAMRPQLILADEPTGSLDSHNGTRILKLLSELNQTRNLTILMATHSAQAAGFAQRTLEVRDGLIEQTVSVSEPRGQEQPDAMV